MAKTAPHTDIDWELEEASESEKFRGRDYLTPEEGRGIFEYQAQKLMTMSVEECIRRWEAGEYWEIAVKEEFRHFGNLIAMIPLARQERWYYSRTIGSMPSPSGLERAQSCSDLGGETRELRRISAACRERHVTVLHAGAPATRRLCYICAAHALVVLAPIRFPIIEE